MLIANAVIQPTRSKFNGNQQTPVIDVGNGRGAARIQDCTVTGVVFPTVFGPGGAALRASRSQQVVCSSTTLTASGGAGNSFAVVPGGTGVDVRPGAVVELDRCTVLGGSGSTSENGGAGAVVFPLGQLFAFDSAIAGGAGGGALEGPIYSGTALRGGLRAPPSHPRRSAGHRDAESGPRKPGR